MNKGIIINIRKLLLVFALSFFLIGIGYKYYEWNLLKNLSNLYNTSWKQELKTVERGGKAGDEFFKLQADTFSEKAAADSLVKNYKELSGKLNLYIENEEEYLRLIRQNKDKYLALKTPPLFLFGPQGNFGKETVNLQLKYYDSEEENANRNIASLYLWSNLLSVLRDKSIVEAFEKKIGSNYKNVSKYFSDISTIQSYTENSYRFSHQEEIDKYFPGGLETLQKYKSYLSTYYLVVEDIVNGDYDSAAYKYTNISNNIASLSLNLDSIFNAQADEQRVSNNKKIVEAVSNQASLIKRFKKNNLGKYPFLSTINKWKEDLVLCQMYDFKTLAIYYSITSNYPTAKNFNDLIIELSSVNPKTEIVDNDFDRDVVMFTNDDDRIEFQCKDEADGDTLIFTTIKTD